MNVKEMIEKKVCPNCHGLHLSVQEDYIKCAACGMHGNYKQMKFCEHVPVFEAVAGKEAANGRQLYERFDKYYVMAGTVEGCGRVLQGDFCDACRQGLPRPVDHEVTKSRARPARGGV